MTAPSWPAVITQPLSPIPGVSKHCTATSCTREDTATVDGVHGRRCDQHPPTFVPAYAVHLAVRMGPEAAFTYCRTDLP